MTLWALGLGVVLVSLAVLYTSEPPERAALAAADTYRPSNLLATLVPSIEPWCVAKQHVQPTLYYNPLLVRKLPIILPIPANAQTSLATA